MANDTTPPVKSQRPHPILDYLLALALLVVGLWVFWQAQQLFRADLMSSWARQKSIAWSEMEQDFSIEEWERAERDMRSSIAIAEDSAALHERLAKLYMLRGLESWEEDAKRHEFYSKALVHLKRSLELRPVVGSVWVDLADTYLGLDQVGPQFFEAWSMANRYAPYDPYVMRTLMSLAFAVWPDATPEMRDWVGRMYEQSTEDGREAIRKIAGNFDVQLVPEGAK